MSSIGFPITTALSQAQAAATVSAPPAQTQPAPQTAQSLPEDTVTLSAAAQANAMYQSGQSVSSIASSLGASASIVDSYLGIATAIAVPLHAAHAAHAAPAKAAAPAASADASKATVKG
jgi:3-hydroxy-3-methylglutaryl CoA synthase